MLHRAFLPILLLALLCTGCMNYSEVELVGVRNARLTRLDAQGLSATITVEVNNPNNYRITLADPDVDLYLNDEVVGKAVLDSAVVLAPKSVALYDVPLRATFTQGKGNPLPLLLGSALGGGLKLGAKGTVVGKARGLRKRFPFEAEQPIDLR
ncbi:MAG TPA: LEA type 2 family protein [Flavobacteriales bacterium]|nr:LEA type 2 family protein [Flavobacteriales bacterium]HRP81853.1 LEA type 2 family protein [Flavobacteriales bacterium]HRQ83968.1 LEA type 2 family protein [Flavobacteriales bacterium]